MSKMIHHFENRLAEYGALASGSSAVVSKYAEGLPQVQYIAACVAIFSGTLAALWVCYKFYRVFKGKKPPE